MVEFKVWWIPQIPGKPFKFMVPDAATGELLCDALAKYDLFQYHEGIKPDFSNAGGVMFHTDKMDPDEWVDYDEDEWEYYKP